VYSWQYYDALIHSLKRLQSDQHLIPLKKCYLGRTFLLQLRFRQNMKRQNIIFFVFTFCHVASNRVTITGLPLQSYHYRVTITGLPLQGYHYRVTITGIPLQGYHCTIKFFGSTSTKKLQNVALNSFFF